MSIRITLRWTSALLLPLAITASAADRPQWGEAWSRNMVSPETNLVDSVDAPTGRGVKWRAPLGTQSYATPVVANGRVYIGTNNDVPRDPKHTMDAGVLMCLSESDGSLLWQLVVPKMEEDRYYDWPKTGWQSPPTVEGDRVYVVSNRAEVLCLDARGLANGNDGPFKDEGRHMSPRQLGDEIVTPTDGDVLWLTDMVKEIGMWPHDGAHSSILIDGPFLYLNTGNGVDNTHRKVRKPDAPSLIVLEKSTGRVVAVDDERIGEKIFHATWSSPCLGEANGKRLIIVGGGDGVLYAFEALDHSLAQGAIAETTPGQSAAPPRIPPRKLKKIWSFDCDPAAPKSDVAQYSGNRRTSPSNISGMPVFADGRVYVTAGGDLWWGKRQSWLKCIDPTKTGDVTKTAELWSFPIPHHSMATPAVKDGLVYVTDAARTLHCVNATDGQPVWAEKFAGEFWSSALVADGKVYAASRKGDLKILTATREKRVLSETNLGSPVSGTAVAANGIIYVATMKEIWALSK
jgi:outer membrane protein assembly factor BamB